MKKFLLSIPLLIGVLPLHSATVGTDNAGNYGGSWSSGSNGGGGFGTWTITAGGNAGAFIGNPNAAGIPSMGTTAFSLYANNSDGNGGDFVNADRSFAGGSLLVGQTFSFKWAINWDGNNTTFGNKGFSLFTGAPGSGQIVNVNNGGNEDITINGANTGFGYGTAAMTWSFERVSTSLLRVTANDRDGTGSYSNDFTLADTAVNSFRFYVSDLGGPSSERQPYFNDLQVSGIPEPSSASLMMLSSAGLLALRRRRNA